MAGRLVKRLALLVALGLVLPGGAGAVTLVRPDGQVAQPYQRWADAARVPTVTGTVEVVTDHASVAKACKAAIGCVATGPDRIWLDPSRSYSRRYTRTVLLHELGHHFDFDLMFSEADADFPDGVSDAHAEFERILGHGPVTWVDGSFHSMLERFAEAYAYCALPTRLVGWERGHDGRTVGLRFADGSWLAPNYGYRPSRAQFRRACAAIRRTGGWFMTPAR